MGNSYGYDTFGNLTSKTNTAGAGESSSPGAPTAQHQLPGYFYDAAGNMTDDTFNPAYTYDPEGRIASVGSTSYIYNGDGQRVIKNDPAMGNHYHFLGANGKPVVETDDAGNGWFDTYFQGQLYFRYNDAQWPSSFSYSFYDHLGSTRVILDGNGNIAQDQDFYPFGGTAPGGITSALAMTNPYQFTGKERDAESGNDYFGARYYSSSMGRWMSPDYSDGPDPVPFGDLENPQSLNLYSYVQNNPVNSIDEDGHLDCSGGATQDVACAVTAAAKAVWGWLTSGSDNSSVTTSQTINVPDPPAPGVPEGAPGTATGGLIQAQNDARANPRFTPNRDGTGPTYCNMASCYIGQHTGSNMGPLMTNGVPNLANTDANTLAHSGSYHQVGRAEAQRLANLGKTVYGVMAESGHGHIITVRPNNGPYTGSAFPSTGPNDPIINDIGRNIGVYPLSQQRSPSFRQGVVFYAPN